MLNNGLDAPHAAFEVGYGSASRFSREYKRLFGQPPVTDVKARGLADSARPASMGSAHYILGPFGPDTDLRRYGLRLCERGGKNAKKRAAVAVARKLAVLLHCLWVSGEVYEPLRQGMSPTIAPAVAA
jgi:hypothetical protein